MSSEFDLAQQEIPYGQVINERCEESEEDLDESEDSCDE